ncbi:Calycin [Trinorchestia longiramus]|nr:Calycin [Trinorchestia longiramus]
MTLTGKFVHVSNDNYEPWLISIGIPAEAAAKYNAAKPHLEVTKSETGIVVKTTAGDKVFSNSVVFGQDSEIDIAGLKYTVNVQAVETGFNGTVKFGGKSGTFTIEKTSNGFVQTVVIDGVTAKRTYNKE